MWGRRNFSHTESCNPALLPWDGLSHGALAAEPAGRGGGVQTGRRKNLHGEKFWRRPCRGRKAREGKMNRRIKRKQEEETCLQALACLGELHMEAEGESIREYSLKMFCKHTVTISNRKMAPTDQLPGRRDVNTLKLTHSSGR